MKINSHLARKPAKSKTILLERWLAMASAASLLAMASTASGVTLTWNTAGPTDTWTPIGGNANWLPDNIEWTDGNAAVFDNATGESITIPEMISPASIAIGANNGNWIFTGTGSIGGSSTLTKTGTGTLMLATSNTYSGATSISGGILAISNNFALGSTAGIVTANGTATLQLQGGLTVSGKSLTLTTGTAGGTLENLSGTNEWTGTVTMNVNKSSYVKVTGGALTLSGTLALSGGGTSASVANNGTGLLINGTITGAGMGFTASGTGPVIISGANTFGSSTVGLRVGTSSTVQITDETTYAAGDQTITHNGLGVGRVTFAANTGTGSILQLRANGQNNATPQTLTYGNNVSISGASGVYGIIDVGRQGGTGTHKTLALGNLTTGANSGALSVTGESDYSLAIGSVIITGTSKSASFNPTTANLSIGSVGNTGATLSTLNLNGTAPSNTVTGAIADGTAPTAVTKGSSAADTGTWSLNGNSSYSGTTAINYGTLLINGNNAAASGAVTVANAATLGGKGIIGGATAVNNGASLAPGNGGPGTLTFNGDLNLASGTSRLLFEAGDLVTVNGALSLASAWNLAVTGADFRNGGSVVLFTYASAGTLNINADIDVSGLGFAPSGPLSLTNTGSSIILNGISSVYGIPKTTVLSIR